MDSSIMITVISAIPPDNSCNGHLQREVTIGGYQAVLKLNVAAKMKVVNDSAQRVMRQKAAVPTPVNSAHKPNIH